MHSACLAVVVVRVGGAVAQLVEHENPSPFDLSGIPGRRPRGLPNLAVVGSNPTGTSHTLVFHSRGSTRFGYPPLTRHAPRNAGAELNTSSAWSAVRLWHGVSTSSPSLVFTARPVWADGGGLSGQRRKPRGSNPRLARVTVFSSTRGSPPLGYRFPLGALWAHPATPNSSAHQHS